MEDSALQVLKDIKALIDREGTLFRLTLHSKKQREEVYSLLLRTKTLIREDEDKNATGV